MMGMIWTACKAVLLQYYFNINDCDSRAPDDGKGNYVWTWTSTNGGSGSSLDDRFNFGQDSTYFGAPLFKIKQMQVV